MPMDQIIPKAKAPSINDSSEANYGFYARPMTSKLLAAMELSKNYIRGENDYLYYEQNGKNHRVLDLTGGYGANLLGHRHPRLLQKIEQWYNEGTPSLTQGSLRKSSGDLAKRISETLQAETGEGPWVTTLSNSGTEAVEAALKHSLLFFQNKLVSLEQEIIKEMNLAIIKIKRAEPTLQRRWLAKLRKDLLEKSSTLKMSEERKSYIYHQIAHLHELEELVEFIKEINTLQLSQKPQFVALERAYHGKTMGALALTYNESFRNPFYLDASNNQSTHFISQHLDAVAMSEFFQSTLQDLIFLSDSTDGISWSKHSFSLIAAAFVEPIQGEAGVVPVSYSFLALLKKFSLQEDFLLVFDEIQAGMYRTGTLASGSHSDITADTYIFSKSLGGGMAKIAATTIIKRKYIEEFGLLHTSTFAEDDFSSLIALEVLNILQDEHSPLGEGMKTADYLWVRLDSVRNLFPEIIKDLRGKGLMLAIEFNDLFTSMGFEFKTICDAKMQGYMIASALLNKEGIRMNPSLSNNLTLRIAPSLFINHIQIEEFITGLINVCQALHFKNIQYFLSAMYPNETVTNERTRSIDVKYEPGQRPLAVFLCHLIDEDHIRKVTKALNQLPGPKLLEKLALTKEMAEFKIYHAQTLRDINNNEMDIIMLGVPVTSEELKKTFTSKKRYQVIQKVQNAVDFAKELGANTVGLGQFTSIVSGNGLYLNPRGMNLTTGNAYTIALTVQSALRSANEKNVDLANAHVALIGAAGNIMSVASALMMDKVGKVSLIHHSPIATSLKYQEAVKRIINETLASSSTNKITQTIKQFWQADVDLMEFLNIPEVKEVFNVSSNVLDIKEAEIVLSGASASSGFLTLDLFKQDAVVVDVAVPPSIKPELLNKIKTDRPDLTYHMGGIAKLPQAQTIDLFLLPLEENESYACMAETFSLGFSGEKNFLNIGDLNKNIVLDVERIAEKVGFRLGRVKEQSSL